MNTKGMTLLEVVLAMTLLSILALSSSTLMTVFQRNFMRETKTSNAGEDVRIAFSKFEQAVHKIAEGRSIKFNWNILPAPTADTYNATVTMQNTVGNVIVGEIDIDYVENLNTSQITITNSAGFSEVILSHGHHFKPYAILKDFDNVGAINSGDVTIRDSCLNNFTNCVRDPSCITATTGVVDLNATSCIQSNVFPFIEISPDGSILYFSLRGQRSFQGGPPRATEGMTKAVFLETAGV